MNAQQKKRPSGCYWLFLLVLLVGLGISMALNMGLLVGSAFRGERLTRTADGPEDQFPRFTTRWSYGDGEAVVVRIPLDGIITRQPEGGLFSPRIDRVQMTLNRIRAARNDPSVRAILLEVDSPGGAVTPSDEIYYALRRFRESDEERRVVVFSRDVAASGAYYAAMAGDWIMAEPTAIVGSIGVMIQTLNWRELSERIGIRDTTIKSGETKDILNPFRDASDEELGILQDLVDSMHDRFAGIVQASRGLDQAAMGRLADGRVFTAADALSEGLIDEIGYWDDAVKRTAAVLGVPSVRIVRYEHRPDWSDWIASLRTPHPVHTLLNEIDRPRILYLWRP